MNERHTTVGLLTIEFTESFGGVGRYYQKIVEQSEGSVVVFPVEELQAQPWYTAIWAVKRWIRELQLQHIVVGHILPLGTIMWVLSYLMPIRYSVFVHGMDITVPQRYARKRWLLNRILNKAHRIITVSEYTESHITQLNSAWKSKITILPPGPFITPEVVEQDHTIDSNNDRCASLTEHAPYIVSVGRIVERKGFDYTVKALYQLAQAKQLLDLRYIIIGDGLYRAQLEQLIAKLHLQERVEILSGLSDAEVGEWLAHSTALMMPSRIVNQEDFEGFGIVVLEANTFGKVAVGGNTSGMRDAIINNKTGLLVNPDSIDDIANAIVEVCANADRRQAMEAQAKQWVSIEHNWSKKYQTLLEVIA